MRIKHIHILTLILIFWFGNNTFSQKDIPLNLPRLDQQAAHFGYSLGLNTMDFIVRASDDFLLNSFDTVFAVEIGKYVGFNVNMISNLRLSNYLSLRFLPGLIFGQRNLNYKYLENGEYRLHSMMIESTFVDLPLYLKYKAARINNWRPFVLAGASARIDLAAQRKIRIEELPKIKLKPFDVYYETGIGVDFFLEYFMFGIELKGSWGIFNIVSYDNTEYSKIYRKLNSRMLILSFHFEGGKLDKIKWWD